MLCFEAAIDLDILRTARHGKMIRKARTLKQHEALKLGELCLWLPTEATQHGVAATPSFRRLATKKAVKVQVVVVQKSANGSPGSFRGRTL